MNNLGQVAVGDKSWVALDNRLRDFRIAAYDLQLCVPADVDLSHLGKQ
jgi:hypothetical protein